MSHYCFVYDCRHRSEEKKCSFFSFPSSKKAFNKWRELCRRGDKDPSATSKVCSCHFVDGKKENGPSIFSWRADKDISLWSLTTGKRRHAEKDGHGKCRLGCCQSPERDKKKVPEYFHYKRKRFQIIGSKRRSRRKKKLDGGSSVYQSIPDFDHDCYCRKPPSTGSINEHSKVDKPQQNPECLPSPNEKHVEEVSEEAFDMEVSDEITIQRLVPAKTPKVNLIPKGQSTPSKKHKQDEQIEGHDPKPSKRPKQVLKPQEQGVSTNKENEQGPNEVQHVVKEVSDVTGRVAEEKQLQPSAKSALLNQKPVVKTQLLPKTQTIIITKSPGKSPSQSNQMLPGYQSNPSQKIQESQEESNVEPCKVVQEIIKERDSLKKELKEATLQIALLSSELDLIKVKRPEPGNHLEFCSIRNNQELFNYYTGLPNVETFDTLLKWLRVDKLVYFNGWSHSRLCPEDQLLLTLIKLKLNSDFTDLSVRFQVSRTSVRNIFLTFLHAMHTILMPMMELPKSENSTVNMQYPSSVDGRCYIDCTEVLCAARIPCNSRQTKTCLSTFRASFKGLVACSTLGAISFVSNLYPASTTDRTIVQESGILDLFEEGDLIFADKQFSISDLLPPGVFLNFPPVLEHEKPYSGNKIKFKSEIVKAKRLAKKMIGGMKSYYILDCIPVHLRQFNSLIFQVVACLANFHHQQAAQEAAPVNASVEEDDQLIDNSSSYDLVELSNCRAVYESFIEDIARC